MPPDHGARFVTGDPLTTAGALRPQERRVGPEEGVHRRRRDAVRDVGLAHHHEVRGGQQR